MMQPGSANGQGHITKSRNDMNLAELHEAYDALLLDKMQVVDQKDKLFDQNQELKALVKEQAATIDMLQGQLDLLQHPESGSPFREGVSITAPPPLGYVYPEPDDG